MKGDDFNALVEEALRRLNERHDAIMERPCDPEIMELVRTADPEQLKQIKKILGL